MGIGIFSQWFFVGARLDEIRSIGLVMVILDHCGKSPQQKWLKPLQNANLAITKASDLFRDSISFSGQGCSRARPVAVAVGYWLWLLAVGT